MLGGSAKLSQSASMQGLRVGAPIGLRTGYDLLTAHGRRKAMEVIERQQPKIIHRHQFVVHGANYRISTILRILIRKGKKDLPLVEFCARVAMFQIEHGRYFIIENPASPKIWFTKCFQRLLKKHAVDMRAFDMRDPNGY